MTLKLIDLSLMTYCLPCRQLVADHLLMLERADDVLSHQL